MFPTVFEQGQFRAIQVDLKNEPLPDLKLDTFPVPLEARIEPWLEREANSPFSLGRLEMEEIYPSGPLKVLRPLFVNGLKKKTKFLTIRRRAKEGAYLKGHKRPAALCCAFRHPPTS